MSDQSFNIKITSTAELAALKATEASLTKQISVARALGQEYSKAAGELEKVQSRIGQFGAGAQIKEGIISGLDRIPVVGEAIKIASGGLAGLAAGFGLLAKGVQEFSQAEDAVASLDAALAQSGQLTEENRVKMQDLAGQLQDTTAIADEKWTAVLAKLTQFGSKADSIDKDADAVKNLAGIMGGDLESAAMMVARAMQGNYVAFSRLGIVIDDSLSPAEKLAKLYEALANRGAGQLEARAKTLSGQWQTLKNNSSDLFESFGRGVSQTGVLQSVLYGLGKSAGWLAGMFGGTVPQVHGLNNAIEGTKMSLDNAETSATKLKEAIASGKTEAEEISKALGDSITLLDQLKGFGDAESQAKRKLAHAQVDRDVQNGMPAGVAAKRHAQIDKQFDIQDYGREQANANAKKADMDAAQKDAVEAFQDAQRELDQKKDNQKLFVESESKAATARRIRQNLIDERDAIGGAEYALKIGKDNLAPGTLSEKGLAYYDDPKLLEGAKLNLKKLQGDDAAARGAANAAHVGFGDQTGAIKAAESSVEEFKAAMIDLARQLNPQRDSLDREMQSRAKKFPLDQRTEDTKFKTGEAERQNKEDERRRVEEERANQSESQRVNGRGRGRETSSAILNAADAIATSTDEMGAAILERLNRMEDSQRKVIAALQAKTRVDQV